jgi:hypothetical protein
VIEVKFIDGKLTAHDMKTGETIDVGIITKDLKPPENSKHYKIILDCDIISQNPRG